VVGGKLYLRPDIWYRCPNTVYQSTVDRFFVEPGFLANILPQDVTNALWQISFATQTNADGSTTMQLNLNGGTLILTRPAN